MRREKGSRSSGSWAKEIQTLEDGSPRGGPSFVHFSIDPDHERFSRNNLLFFQGPEVTALDRASGKM
jgi:hypothetical protein